MSESGERVEGTGPFDGIRDLDGLVTGAVVDGVRVLTAPGEGDQVAAGIVFRVGWADEQLARSGITHLVEHLALFGRNPGDIHHNGTTDEFSTHFHATGSPEKVVQFLNEVCAALRSLPLDRAEVEKGVLETEAARRGSGLAERIRLERYGARGPGLGGYEGFGLPAVTADDVSEWAAERFTAQNAVAWMTVDELPEGLDLRLPQGRAWPIPELADLLTETPAFFRGAPGGLLLEAIVPATAAGLVFSQVLSRALFRVLRQENGLSYEARCDWERLDGSHARLTLFADALPEKQAAVVGEVVDLLAALRVGRVDEADLEAARGSIEELRQASSLGARLLPSTAFKLAAGIDSRGPERLAEEFSSVTASDIIDLAQQFSQAALAQIPEGSLDWAGFTARPAWSQAEVDGRAYSRRGQDEAALVIGDRGVMMREPEGFVTVLFDDAEALEAWPDGARRIVGADGFQILIEPTLYDGMPSDAVAAIDAAVPAGLHIPRPARSPELIPRPA